jgi:transposase, IS30 family
VAVAGRKRDVVREARYWQLLSTGMGTVQACRDAGIGRRTGLRWRLDAERRAREQALTQRSERFLSEVERQQIASLRDRGWSMRRIGVELGRPASTISRELKNNTIDGPYDPVAAECRAQRERARPKQSKLELNEWLHDYVESKLEQDWSPEQISGALELEYGDTSDRRIGVETIYRELYRCDGTGLSRALCAHLRTKRSKRRRHGSTTRRRFIDEMTPIADRPAHVELRVEPGHWEGDLVTGMWNKSAVGTLAERATGLLKLVHLPIDHSAESLTIALPDAMADIPAVMKRTLTWDQGGEMAGHRAIAKETGFDIYFADAGSPWQRGSNENTNGLLRQYLPKGTDLSVYSAEYLREVENKLNSRPRKRLGWATPQQEYDRLVQSWNQPSVATTQ